MTSGNKRDFTRLFVAPSSTIKEAVTVIDRESMQIALVCDGDRLLGTVTDGDVRRGLLRGLGLDSPVEAVMNVQFKRLPAGSSARDALALMRREMLHQIPLVDDAGNIVDLYLLEDLVRTPHLQNTVVIMAGGEGKRLRPLTADCPKPMLRVGGKPLLEIILEKCIEAGFANFLISVNYLREQIQHYFSDGQVWGVNIRYLEESQPLGTGGALSLMPEMPELPILVMNGDVLTRVDFSRLMRFHNDHSAAMTMCVREHTTQIPYGVVAVDGVEIEAIEEKPVLSHYVNAGIYVLDPSLLGFIPREQFFDLPDLVAVAKEQAKRVSAFPIHEDWLDVGLPETLERAHGEWC
jgi:dTDP-glucose pyrophosphorylase/CBS domain-containing protein